MGSKNSHTGITWVVKQDRLTAPGAPANILKKEQGDLDNLLEQLSPLLNEPTVQIPVARIPLIEKQLQEIKKIADIWSNLYHSLVLLNAAMDPPGPKGIDVDEEGARPNTDPQNLCGPEPYCLDESHETPAWSDGDAGEEGWLGLEHAEASLIAEFEKRFKVVGSYVQDLEEVISEAILQRSIRDENELPFLQYFLKVAKPYLQALNLADIEPIDCLKTCLRLVPPIEQNEINKNYIEGALYRIANIWGENNDLDFIEKLQSDEATSHLSSWRNQVKDRLNKISDWWNMVVDMGEAEFIKWLSESHIVLPMHFTSGGEVWHEVINGSNEKAKWDLAGMAAMLYFNSRTLELIYSRCFDKDTTPPFAGLGDTIDHLVGQLPDDENNYRNQWLSLRVATFGSIAWHIFHQISSTVGRVHPTIN